MKTSWTTGLNKELSSEMKREYASSGLLRERLTKLLEDKIEARRKASRGVEGYDKASWAYLQADLIGYERALFETISLISNNSVTKD